jgi:hypothetical protein
MNYHITQVNSSWKSIKGKGEALQLHVIKKCILLYLTSNDFGIWEQEGGIDGAKRHRTHLQCKQNLQN